ncbi:hypothetical protein NDU88_001559 [Pleurodeles waltl]|uniref:Myb-like domain-containing protein n=1 Tax=Pleurodeles waltl TaxID=8319 RepID=A0AAV7KT80_PLEWA|nr:hypothetical protein NDU88_001559 [Pleurodeles waltl]
MHHRGRDCHFLSDHSFAIGPSTGEDLHCMCCCDLCLEPTMARVFEERVPAFTSAELEKLVDGVSTHQKKGIWCSIAKDVWTLEVYGRRSTHCRKRWEDLRCWAQKMAEAQLGMANEEGVPIEP